MLQSLETESLPLDIRYYVQGRAPGTSDVIDLTRREELPNPEQN